MPRQAAVAIGTIGVSRYRDNRRALPDRLLGNCQTAGARMLDIGVIRAHQREMRYSWFGDAV